MMPLPAALSCSTKAKTRRPGRRLQKTFIACTTRAKISTTSSRTGLPRKTRSVGRRSQRPDGSWFLAEHTEESHTNALFALFAEHADAPRYRPNASLPLPERNYRKAMQMFSGSLIASAETALQLLLDVEEELDRASLREARAALQGWAAHYATGDQKTKLFTSAIEWAKQAARAEPRLAIAHMTLAFLLLERAEVTQGQYPTGRNDIAEAALALSTAAERCETALAETESAGTADVDGLGYPRWSDLFDGRMERAYLVRGVNKAEWAQEVRAAIAWRCRSMLSDLSAANEQLDESFMQAQAAVIDLPHEAEGILRLAQREAMTGQLELARASLPRRIVPDAPRVCRLARTRRRPDRVGTP